MRTSVRIARFVCEPPVCFGQAALGVLPGAVATVGATAGDRDGTDEGPNPGGVIGVTVAAVAVAGATVGVGVRVTVWVGSHAASAAKVSANSIKWSRRRSLICR